MGISDKDSVKKVASDRASVIEDALDSFEWLYRIGIWLAFALMGAGFLFWAGPEKELLSFVSYGIFLLTTIPLKTKNLAFENLKVLAALTALVAHILALQSEFHSLPSVLLIVPAFLAAELFETWFLKSSFAIIFWSVYTYWVFGEIPEVQKMGSSFLGAGVTLCSLYLFKAIRDLGKKQSLLKLEALRGRNDFNQQRIHASRLQTMGELSAALIHELSNPITNLQGFFGQLSEVEELRLNLRFRETMQRIEANVTRVKDLILGFRSFSRLQPTQEVDFSLEELFKNLDVLARHAFKSHDVELEISYENSECHILGNRVEIGQVVMNFMLNGLAAVKDAPLKKVKVGARLEESCVIIFVEDSGSGVPEDLKEKIFRPFFSTKGEDGSGLGLYISKLIAENHECELSVNKSEDASLGGACFELKFPAKRNLEKRLAA
jgi:signal transduction histidine kinase